VNAATARREDRRCATFLAVVVCVGLGYTTTALEMDWRTSSGLIGPGFFPVVLGVGIVACAGTVLARILFRLRSRPNGPTKDAEDGGVPDSPWVVTMLALVVLMVLFVVFLQPLGAVIGSALFMLATLQVLNPGRQVANAVLSLMLPVGLYLLLEILLGAGLPPGPIPVQRATWTSSTTCSSEWSRCSPPATCGCSFSAS